MLLAIDVGNTNFTCGVFREDELVTTFRMTTKEKRTSDEFGLFFCNMIKLKGFQTEDITDVIIASVVPDVMHSLTNSIMKYFNCKPIVVGAGTKTGIRISSSNPKEIGADRVVDAVAGFELYGGPVLIIDYGTATTYDLISQDGEFLAGVTSPGIGISANALWNDAAKLPKIEIKKPDSILAKETISSMQAGLVFGNIGQTEYIVRKMIEESGFSDVKVIATGGLGRLIADETELIHEYDPMLTMKGLLFIYKRQKGTGKER